MESTIKTITWVVNCKSRESLRDVERFAEEAIGLDKTFVDVIVAFPNGIEKRTTESHRVGDYFDQIRLLPENASSFELAFHPRPTARRYWKDLMVMILDSICAFTPGVSVSPGKKVLVS